MVSRRELDTLVLDVEFVLISVVQGVALTTLAVESTAVLRTGHFEAWPYALSGLLFVLTFWSAALIHAISFVRWPMDLVHYFFYFGLALLECLTFSQLEHPRGWFALSIACYVVTLALYAYDFFLIRRRRTFFEGSEAERALYHHIEARQRLEFLLLVPGGLVFCVAAWRLLATRPEAAFALGVSQAVVSAAFLASLVRSFARRQALLLATAE